MDPASATALIAMIESAYDQELAPSRAELYRAELSGLECFDCGVLTLRAVIRTSRWLPTIAEILEAHRARLGVCEHHRRAELTPPPEPPGTPMPEDVRERIRAFAARRAVS